jgi:helicase MOV-10
VDEATQADELETISTILQADQVVLIGDQKQLGPIYKCEVPKCDSMFTRLLESGFPNFVMLKESFRMHPDLLELPNSLYYDNKLVSKHRISHMNMFLTIDRPMLFINSESEESGFGNSKFNNGEAEKVVELFKFLTER